MCSNLKLIISRNQWTSQFHPPLNMTLLHDVKRRLLFYWKVSMDLLCGLTFSPSLSPSCPSATLNLFHSTRVFPTVVSDSPVPHMTMLVHPYPPSPSPSPSQPVPFCLPVTSDHQCPHPHCPLPRPATIPRLPPTSSMLLNRPTVPATTTPSPTLTPSTTPLPSPTPTPGPRLPPRLTPTPGLTQTPDPTATPAALAAAHPVITTPQTRSD